ncbi:hypothetical protein [Umezawaea beigongshangensis]|uniref:hypothetical protein n=1 Tax=Umezawaea beigongshangensis TaxID=2780383 RepID=UPI0018F1836A|nr:hypothetical protein [Umezawaea beigongshangensis]
MPENDRPRPLTLTGSLLELLRTQPGPDATPEQRAAWFDHKANVLDGTATDPWTTDKAEAAELAARARRTAAAIRAEHNGGDR